MSLSQCTGTSVPMALVQALSWAKLTIVSCTNKYFQGRVTVVFQELMSSLPLLCAWLSTCPQCLRAPNHPLPTMPGSRQLPSRGCSYFDLHFPPLWHLFLNWGQPVLSHASVRQRNMASALQHGIIPCATPSRELCIKIKLHCVKKWNRMSTFWKTDLSFRNLRISF